jgi:hypothetical protein
VTTLDANPVAIYVVKDAILAALNALTPTNSAAWDTHPPDTVRALTLPNTGASRAVRLYTAQFQDAGAAAAFLSNRGWEGVVLCKSFGRTETDARAGLALIDGAMRALTSTTANYRVSARKPFPVNLPREVTPGYGILYNVTARRIA